VQLPFVFAEYVCGCVSDYVISPYHRECVVRFGTPYLSQYDASTIAVVFDLCKAYWYTQNGDNYTPLYGALATLEFDRSLCEFVFADCNGDVWYSTATGEFDRVERANSPDQSTDTERMPSTS